MSVTTMVILATPAFAQTHPERIAELEEQVSLLAEQLGELRTELDEAKEAGAVGALESLRTDVTANQVAIRATQSATEWSSRSTTRTNRTFTIPGRVRGTHNRVVGIPL